jgi:hypothetical protein
MIFICFQTNCSNKHFDAQKNNLGYKKGNQKIVLEILNDNNYLQLGTKEKIKVKCENIKTEKLSFSGKGISFYKSDKDLQNELILNINLNNEEIKVLKNYELVMSYYDGDNSFVHKFTIPIKDK